jgi:hypothetical protein
MQLFDAQLFDAQLFDGERGADNSCCERRHLDIERRDRRPTNPRQPLTPPMRAQFSGIDGGKVERQSSKKGRIEARRGEVSPNR